MIDRFEQLLDELGPLFGLSLHKDHLGACTIKIRDHLKVQLQLDLQQETLYFFSKIIEIPPGKFREEVLKEALKANGTTDPIIGIFAYKPSTNHLVLFQEYPIEILNGETLAALLGPFLEMAESWHHAIESGYISPGGNRSLPSPFGLKP